MGRVTGGRGLAGRISLALSGSVRHKLLVLVLAPLLLGVPMLLLIVWFWGTEGYNRLMVNKVSADLGVAREYLDRAQSRIAARLEGVAQSHRLAVAMDRGQDLSPLMAETARREGLDYLLLLDGGGRVIASATNARSGDRRSMPLVNRALAGESGFGLAVMDPDELDALDADLGRRARLDLVATPNARPADHRHEGRGMMMVAAVPVAPEDGGKDGEKDGEKDGDRKAGGTVRAVLEGGILLNGNLALVDHLNDLVYSESSLPADSAGAATLFLDDVRIATSVRLRDGARALGTRVSQAVYDRVMGAGQPWIGSAFVVDRPYVSGYVPLHDVSGARIGMLYVGFLEAPLHNALTQAMAGMFLMFLLVSALGMLASIRWARAIFLPLERMSRVIERVESGDDGARVGPDSSRDEIGRLSRAFDHLLDSLVSRQAEIRRWGQELDEKVAARTRELEDANQTLRQARQHLVMNEKLMAIGELTAGVAHEINNPVAVIQGNLDLLKEILGEQAAPVEPEIRLIDEQTLRIQGIVNKLLQFARPGDFAGYAESTDINAVIADSLLLTRHNLNRARVRVETGFQATVPVEVNRGEMLQVLINLIVNAMQAMPDGGTLTLTTEDLFLAAEEMEGVEAPSDGPGQGGLTAGNEAFDGVRVVVRDTGLGIATADLGRIFDPFFTTKKQKGTGLGLSISYAIVQRYGGRITVDSAPGHGTAFTLWLRRQARFAEQPGAPVFSARFLD
ncbi:MAG: HAMP domain-containing protein [Telmatospirillum sp.]|nr:HAMP domain-containing protein [Telmatospirillum sp.]